MEAKLRKFRDVVMFGGFTAAAHATNVSQPALSMAIKELERELGVQLLEKSGQKIKLSPAGKVAYEASQQMHTAVLNLHSQLQELAQSTIAVRIGMIDSIAEALFNQKDADTKFIQRNHTTLIVDNSSRLVSEVSAGRLDCAYITRPTKPLPAKLAEQVIGSELLVCVAKPKASSLGNTQNPLPYISYNRGSTSEQLIKQALLERGINFNPVLYSTSPHIMLQLCLSGIGFAVLPRRMVEAYIKARKLELAFNKDASEIQRPITYISQMNRYEPIVMSDFTQRVRDQLFKS